MSECYFVENDEREFYCDLGNGQIGWSKHIIDAVLFDDEDSAQEVVNRLGIIGLGVSWRSGPPQAFLYTNPHLPLKEDRIRRNGEPQEMFYQRVVHKRKA